MSLDHVSGIYNLLTPLLQLSSHCEVDFSLKMPRYTKGNATLRHTSYKMYMDISGRPTGRSVSVMTCVQSGYLFIYLLTDNPIPA